ncbi:hypothetical protein H1O16_gp106 [Burkholderia phage BcepSaruman]|uniref:Uncharacterized protein n=1 Tax=Burkholderia phage BcepSaruman TaxID=2530032 RepID=A0A4D5ZCV5_9CAUD|nr:hypothetical protein H1O16_gp106 [Burkholderia phage BcepSaruman]QBX06519.1 hypothetical protein BcepSaruman_106 [Burkholderia phage BcepSaruman]
MPTLASFRGGFIALNGRAPDEQEIWDAAVAEGLRRSAEHTEPQVGELTSRALDLYRPPFVYNCGFIMDADGNMVADDPASEEGMLRLRGWGRIQYEKDGEKLQDRVGHIIANMLTRYWHENFAPSFTTIYQVEASSTSENGWIDVPRKMYSKASDTANGRKPERTRIVYTKTPARPRPKK